MAGHLPDLAAGRDSPVELSGPVAFRHTPNEIAQVEPAPHAPHGRHDQGALVHSDVHRVTHVDVRILEQCLADAQPLAVAPLLDPGDHAASFGYPKYSPREAGSQLRDPYGPIPERHRTLAGVAGTHCLREGGFR